MYKQIEVQGYFRKDGTWVSPHSRTIQVTKFRYKKTLSSIEVLHNYNAQRERFEV